MKVFLESMVMSSKLHSTHLFHFLHKNIVVLVCRINDRRKKINSFLLIVVLPGASVVGEMGRLTIRGWWLLLNSSIMFS